MTDLPHDLAPADNSAPAIQAEANWPRALVYSTGLVVALVLTATSFWAANTSQLWGPGVSLGLAVLAIAQMGIHLVFFLHITTGPDNTNNVLALAFGMVMVTAIVTGSLWIMSDLSQMMPGGSMGMHMQH